MTDKYEKLWQWVASRGEATLILTYAEIADIAGVPIDHSFLNCKKNLEPLGYRVKKISMKAETVTFERIELSEA